MQEKDYSIKRQKGIQKNRESALERYHRIKDTEEYKLQQRIRQKNLTTTKLKKKYSVTDEWIEAARAQGRWGLQKAVFKLIKERKKKVKSV